MCVYILYLRTNICVGKNWFLSISNLEHRIGDNAVTSSIRIAQVFSDLVGKKTRTLREVYGEMLKYIINYPLYLAYYRHIFI